VRRASLVVVCAVAGVAACAGAVPAVAEEAAEALRPCAAGDLLGAWEVVRFGVSRSFPVDRRDPYFYRHQRYVFAADATVRHLRSEARITPEAHRRLLAATPATTWAVDGEGKLLLPGPGAARLERADCAVLTRKVIDPRSQVPALPGDVLLTHYDGGRPVMRRQLRKLDDLDE